jgi:hypothetical protein
LKNFPEPAFQTRRKPLHESRPTSLGKDAPCHPTPRASFEANDEYIREKVDLRASRLSIRPAAAHLLCQTSHGNPPALASLEHFHVEIVGEYAVESQMIERRLIRGRGLDRIHDKIGQIVD